MAKDLDILGRPISRRTFAKIMGATAAAAGLGAGGVRVFTEATEANAVVPVSNALGACRICSSECGYIARAGGASGFELFGNPADPVCNTWGPGTDGVICVKGYAGPEKALSPDRVIWPMKRTNPLKGPDQDPGFVRITWAEADTLAAQKLNETIRVHGPKSIALISRSNDWINRFRDALRTPNVMAHHSTCFTTYTWAWPALVPQVARGSRSWTNDFRNATYLLSFGHDQLGRAQNPTVTGVIKALENGAGVTVFDPRHSNMAAKALAYGGRYYEVKPGTDPAIMWAMIKWIITNIKWDANFINNYVNATDFDELTAYVNANGFADGELAPTADVTAVAAWAEAKSGVPAADILTVVREFTNDGNYTDWRPNLMTHKRDGAGGPNYVNSWRAAYALLVLEVLVGGVDKLGGNILDRTFSLTPIDTAFPRPALPAEERDAAGVVFNRIDRRHLWPGTPPGQGSFETMTTSIVQDDPYPVRYMFMTNYNLPLNSTDTKLTVEAMQRCFVVNHCYMADEGAWMSDILMPETSTFERTYISPSGRTGGNSSYAFIKLNEPMFAPIGGGAGGRSLARVLAGIAEAADLGAAYQGACQAYANAQPAAWQTQNLAFMTNRDSLSRFCTTTGVQGGPRWSGDALTNRRLADLAAGAPGNGWVTNITSLATFRAVAGWAGDRTGIRPVPADAPLFVNYSRISTVVPAPAASRIRLNVRARTHGGIPNAYARIPDPAGPSTDALGRFSLVEPYPGWKPPRPTTMTGANPAVGRFIMLVIREPMLTHTESQTREMMVELSDRGRIEMHPDSAALLGIAQGDRVSITAPTFTRGTGTAEVRLTRRIRKDCVMIAHGWGRWGLSTKGNYDAQGNESARKFGPNASTGMGADNNEFVRAMPYLDMVAQRDPSASPAMIDVILTVTKTP